jgi:CheY-like chemotaxis protein
MVRKSVLIAEDEASVRTLLGKLLARDGFELLLAEDGARAIAAATRATRLDLLVTDFDMPHVDGLRLAATVRATFPGIPVLLMSSSPDALARGGKMLLAPSRFLLKPFDVAVFHAAVRDLLATHRNSFEQPSIG